MTTNLCPLRGIENFSVVWVIIVNQNNLIWISIKRWLLKSENLSQVSVFSPLPNNFAKNFAVIFLIFKAAFLQNFLKVLNYINKF